MSELEKLQELITQKRVDINDLYNENLQLTKQLKQQQNTINKLEYEKTESKQNKPSILKFVGFDSVEDRDDLVQYMNSDHRIGQYLTMIKQIQIYFKDSAKINNFIDWFKPQVSHYESQICEHIITALNHILALKITPQKNYFFFR